MTTSSRRPGPLHRCVRALLAFAAAALCAHDASATLPRAVGRAFLDAGIPLNAVAIVVQEAGTPRPLFAYDAERPMNPASVMKLVTTFAALELLGPEYRWKTESFLGGPLVDGTLDGDLIVKGYGDPKITLDQWQRFMGALRARGLAAVTGDLVLDR
jgi:D-alanyl-D-alanine carboxypeptidase/D-alanyl-D-alanine-endopeptidase (penicillin-binding protein 4)